MAKYKYEFIKLSEQKLDYYQHKYEYLKQSKFMLELLQNLSFLFSFTLILLWILFSWSINSYTYMFQVIYENLKIRQGYEDSTIYFLLTLFCMLFIAYHAGLIEIIDYFKFKQEVIKKVLENHNIDVEKKKKTPFQESKKSQKHDFKEDNKKTSFKEDLDLKKNQ